MVDKFNYDQNNHFDIRQVSTQNKNGVSIRDMTTLNPFGVRRAAYYVQPEGGDGPFPCILYVHWYEPEAKDSNRTQFMDEAREMAKRGAASLLVETMWSDRDWFIKREQSEDLDNSINQVIELRQAMDLLLAQPGTDPDNFAYIGHDFGAMYGAAMGAVDPRPKYYVLMAGTPRFPDWFLYYPQLEGQARQDFIDSFTEIDPISAVPNLSPAPILFQFGDNDPHIPKERGEEFFAAAADPKEVKWYPTGHGLNEEAQKDRMAWVSEKLGL